MERIKALGGASLPMGDFSLPPPCIPLRGCPVLAKAVPAGFPSPAQDYTEGRLSLDEHLIAHPEATFFVRVAGNSMTGFGIHNGDLLVVDRSLEPTDHRIVVAVIDGEFTIKQLCRIPSGVLLRSSGDGRDIFVTGDQQLEVWGVVTSSIHTVA
jgi:DNA polymerase V